MWEEKQGTRQNILSIRRQTKKWQNPMRDKQEDNQHIDGNNLSPSGRCLDSAWRGASGMDVELPTEMAQRDTQDKKSKSSHGVHRSFAPAALRQTTWRVSAAYQKDPQKKGDVVDPIHNRDQEERSPSVKVSICFVHPQGVEKYQRGKHQRLDHGRKTEQNVLPLAAHDWFRQALTTWTLLHRRNCGIRQRANSPITWATSTAKAHATLRTFKDDAKVQGPAQAPD
jgi:hypothetical protein